MNQDLEKLLFTLGLSASDFGGFANVRGSDPVVSSPHKIGTATALALVAQGAGIATIHKIQTGQSQDVSVDIARACHANHGVSFLKQRGYPIGFVYLPKEPGNDFFRGSDDRFVYVATMRPEHRAGIFDVLGGAGTAAAIERAIARWPAEELESACMARRMPLSMVRTPEEWRAHPHGRNLIGRPVVEIEKVRDGKPIPIVPLPRPLGTIRVLDVTQFAAGPIIGRTLAEHGADVLRISRPRESDAANFIMDAGFGKRAAYVDLDSPRGVETFCQLVREADVLVHSFRPGSLEKRGISLEQLINHHDGIVVISVTAFGPGPWHAQIAFDPNAQSVTGITVTEGSVNAPKRPDTKLLADYLTGFLGAAGATAALIRRAREGGSYHVRTSLAQVCMWVQDLGLVDRQLAPPNPVVPVTLTMDSPFGELEYLAPVTEFTHLAPYWDRPPQPLGASKPEFLTRRDKQ